MAISDDGRLLCTGTDNEGSVSIANITGIAPLKGPAATARLWDLRTGAELRRLIGHERCRSVTGVAFSPAGDFVATCGHTAVIFYYGIFPETIETLSKHGVALHHLCTWWDVLAAAREGKQFD